ncbi:hypothetical protein MHJ86_10610 [Corynebacterium afermentans]|nr:hypothetical protein [Corynebacterium afermentans]
MDPNTAARKAHDRRTAALAALAGSALAMAACGSSESTVESAVDEPGALNNQGQIDLDALTEVPAEDFLDHSAYVFTFPGTGSNGCTVPIDPTDMDALIPFGCDAIHVGTRERMALEYGTVFGFSGNESRTIELTSDTRELNLGEKVNASGFILARPTEDTVLVKRGANAVVIKNSEPYPFSPVVDYQRLGKKTPIPFLAGDSLDNIDLSSAEEDTICGMSKPQENRQLVAVATQKGTDCNSVNEAIRQYFALDKQHLGDEHSPDAWTSPDGWRCDVDYFPRFHVDFPDGDFTHCLHEDVGGVVMVPVTLGSPEDSASG